jgi:hypothetical protein
MAKFFDAPFIWLHPAPDKYPKPGKTMSEIRKWVRLIEATAYPNVREIPGGERFIVYHGSASITPFDVFDAQHINSQTGASYNAFFFTDSVDTAMTYLKTEEDLKPKARQQYDEWIAIFENGQAELLIRLNAILADHALPTMREFNGIAIMRLELASKDPELKQKLQAIDQEYNKISRYRSAAVDLFDKAANIQTFHTGVLYKCEITLHRPWERDMDGDAFQRDRWHDIFTHATQSGADGVILTNCVDTAVDFGRPATIYAVFEHDQIKILSHEAMDSSL